MLTVYATARSANGRKVLAVCRELGLEPEIREVDVYRGEGRRPEYLAVNPSGRIPALVDAGTLIVESNAILVYLSEAHGAGRLWADDPAGRARIARWLFWESAHWQPVTALVLGPFVGHRLRPDVVAAAPAPDFGDARLAAVVATLEAALDAGPFLAGARLTLADFSVAGMLTYFRAARFPFAAHPRLRGWYERIEALESWRATADPLWDGGTGDAGSD